MESAANRHRPNDLARLQSLWERGVVVAMRIVKPQPFPGAKIMIDLCAAGVSIETIATKVGYSTHTVERMLASKGEDLRTGPHCELRMARLYTLREAIESEVLPCRPNCACTWQPVFRSDLDPGALTPHHPPGIV